MHGRLRLITPPAMEPVTLAEVKLHARIDHDLENGLLATFIAAARQHGEQLTGRQFGEAEYDLLLDGFPHGNRPIDLPRPPLQAVEAVAFVAPDGITQTMSASDYVVDTSGPHLSRRWRSVAGHPPPAQRCDHQLSDGLARRHGSSVHAGSHQELAVLSRHRPL
jgi:uncharacterized phiE125 gp8 family phage protein